MVAVAMEMNRMDKCNCPICSRFDVEVCPKCKTRWIRGRISRSGELAIVDWTCEICEHEWSGSIVVPEKYLAKFKAMFKDSQAVVSHRLRRNVGSKRLASTL